MWAPRWGEAPLHGIPLASSHVFTREAPEAGVGYAMNSGALSHLAGAVASDFRRSGRSHRYGACMTLGRLQPPSASSLPRHRSFPAEAHLSPFLPLCRWPWLFCKIAVHPAKSESLMVSSEAPRGGPGTQGQSLRWGLGPPRKRIEQYSELLA